MVGVVGGLVQVSGLLCASSLARQLFYLVPEKTSAVDGEPPLGLLDECVASSRRSSMHAAAYMPRHSDHLKCPKIVPIEKIAKYIADNVGLAVPEGGSPSDVVCVRCRGEVLDRSMDLSSVRHCVWKKSEALVLTYGRWPPDARAPSPPL